MHKTMLKCLFFFALSTFITTTLASGQPNSEKASLTPTDAQHLRQIAQRRRRRLPQTQAHGPGQFIGDEDTFLRDTQIGQWHENDCGGKRYCETEETIPNEHRAQYQRKKKLRQQKYDFLIGKYGQYLMSGRIQHTKSDKDIQTFDEWIRDYYRCNPKHFSNEDGSGDCSDALFQMQRRAHGLIKFQEPKYRSHGPPERTKPKATAERALEDIEHQTHSNEKNAPRQTRVEQSADIPTMAERAGSQQHRDEPQQEKAVVGSEEKQAEHQRPKIIKWLSPLWSGWGSWWDSIEDGEQRFMIWCFLGKCVAVLTGSIFAIENLCKDTFFIANARLSTFHGSIGKGHSGNTSIDAINDISADYIIAEQDYSIYRDAAEAFECYEGIWGATLAISVLVWMVVSVSIHRSYNESLSFILVDIIVGCWALTAGVFMAYGFAAAAKKDHLDILFKKVEGRNLINPDDTTMSSLGDMDPNLFINTGAIICGVGLILWFMILTLPYLVRCLKLMFNPLEIEKIDFY